MVDGKKIQSFQIIPNYGTGKITMGGGEVQLKKERVLEDMEYSATEGDTLTQQFKDRFNLTFQEFFNIAYTR